MLNRRELLARSGVGLPMLGLASLLQDEAAADRKVSGNPMLPKNPHFAPRAKHVIHVFATGGCSHVDTFDRKPALEKWDGEPIPLDLRTERKTGAAMKSPFGWSRYGDCGHEISDLFRLTAQHADDLCFIRSMHADVPNHEPSLMLMNCGDSRLPRPSVGSWITYGLGTENQNLPGFVAMCPGGMPTKQSDNWRSAFLPGVLQATYLDTSKKKVEELIANSRPTTPAAKQRRQLEVLRELNAIHMAERPDDAALQARVQSFELAYRMQSEADEAFDLAREPQHIQDAYGIHRKQGWQQSRSLLIARRLVERGVRYVQLFHGAGQPWDHHDKIKEGHTRLADEIDRPLAALLSDLKSRGLLQDTLVMFGGEFGRTPVVEMPVEGVNSGTISGRDHNHYGFTYMLAGGGIRGGHVHGATDEFGFAATEDRVHVHDLHATLLHLLGFDHKRLTYRYAGRDFRLTDVHGHVVDAVIA